MVYRPRKFTDDELKKLMIDNPGISHAELARQLKCDSSSVRKRRKKLVFQGFSPDHEYTHTVPDGFIVKGVSQQFKADGTLGQQWVKSKVDVQAMLEAVEATISSLSQGLPAYNLTKVSKAINYTDTMTVYPYGDPHIGLLAWAEECGEDWDLKIAEETFRKMTDIIISKGPASSVGMLEILGDTLHYDNMAGMTARSGNILDTDGRYPKMVQVTTYIILNMINSLLQKHEKVVVDIVRGNHDDVGSCWLTEVIKQVYRREPRVEIIDMQGPIHIYEFGKVLIASHHGHTIKMDNLPITVATDFAEAWGRTKHRYGLTGHIHHDSKLQQIGRENPGMYVESFRTLAAKDSYATWGGWRSKRDTKCIVYHSELGEIERYTASADALILQINEDCL